ncbi:MAG TPA: metallophosphoesterase [Nitriliruptorales bacterium]
MSTWSRAIGTVAATGAACVAYGSLVERRWYRLRRLQLPGVLQAAPGTRLRLLHLSDLHLDPPQQHKVDFVRSLRRQGADLVAVTGDILGGRDAEDAAVDLLASLTSPSVPGVVVLGSNDLFGPVAKGYHHYLLNPDARVTGERLDTPRLIAGLHDHGYRVLRNQAVVLPTRVGPVGLGGIDDPHLEDAVVPDPDAVRPDAAGVVASIGLVHAPYTVALDVLVLAGHRLLLSGHTHGGQVRFPPIGAVVANCDLPLDRIRGASRYGPGPDGDAAWLHVSPGLGTSRYAPFRFACRPEATLLELTT